MDLAALLPIHPLQLLLMKNKPLKLPDKKILTAGPSMTSRELAYVRDAVENGWNDNWSGYLKRFTESFCAYTGCQYALPVASGTAAIHLGLMAMGVGPGDEVIVPDLCWIAAASPVTHLGANPVFADVESDTWCLDPTSVEKKITRRTKAIVPVHLYGHPANMRALRKIANKHKLFILEDSAASLGSEYHGQKTGSLGDIGIFSFQGAKIATTGEGGMLLTSDKNLYDKAFKMNAHGRSSKDGFWIEETGWKYNMSNLQAALGLAQLERIEELVAAKRKINSWYREFLGEIPGVSLNAEKPGIRNNFWMTSIVLNEKFSLSRDEVRRKMLEYNVDTRNFFHPCTAFPMYKQKAKNPVSWHLAYNGINLPSGVKLKKGQVEYICAVIRKLLLS